MQGPPKQQTDLHPGLHGLAFLLACCILITRRPDALFHAQFFAEDGRVWFADAYNLGWWNTFFRAQDGYFQTLPRLGAALALLVPLAMAPLVLNLIAIGFQALTVNLLLSSRSAAWGSLRFRALLAGTYLLLPNCREMVAIITSTQWIMALCVFLLLVASTPRSVKARLFDLALVLLSGLTGPFCFFLAPLALFLAWKRREVWRWAVACELSVLCAVQAWGLVVVDPSGRAHAALGAGATMFVKLLAGQIFLGTLLGGNGLAINAGQQFFVLLLVVAAGGIALVALCFFRAGYQMRLFILLSSMLFAASLLSPVAHPTSGDTRWQMLLAALGVRYWFFPSLAFAWSLLWHLRSRAFAPRAAAAVLLGVMCFGILRDWRIPAFKDLHFAEAARRAEAAPSGTAVTIPENPDGWNMRLVMH